MANEIEFPLAQINKLIAIMTGLTIYIAGQEIPTQNLPFIFCGLIRETNWAQYQSFKKYEYIGYPSNQLITSHATPGIVDIQYDYVAESKGVQASKLAARKFFHTFYKDKFLHELQKLNVEYDVISGIIETTPIRAETFERRYSVELRFRWSDYFEDDIGEDTGVISSVQSQGNPVTSLP